MANKEIKITVPEGYEIDRENSTFECIKFKPKSLTYDDIEVHIAKLKKQGVISAMVQTTTKGGGVASYEGLGGYDCYPAHINRLLALNKLLNVAEYLNDGWKPNWENRSQQKYVIVYDRSCKELAFMTVSNLTCGQVVFKDNESARKAIEILGEDEVKKALGVFE